jgi:riboflavin transporter FmnP
VDTKKLTLTIVFAALAIVLNPALTGLAFAAPFAPQLFYQIWEIPIVIAFLIISPISGIAVALLNTSVLFVIFPGTLPTGPLYNLLATLAMQIGMYATVVIGKKIHCRKNPQANILTSIKWLATTTAIGSITRVALMSVILYLALPQPVPIGFGFNQAITNAYLPLAGFFNATLALYTIPIGWTIALTVQMALRPTFQNRQKN